VTGEEQVGMERRGGRDGKREGRKGEGKGRKGGNLAPTVISKSRRLWYIPGKMPNGSQRASHPQELQTRVSK